MVSELLGCAWTLLGLIKLHRYKLIERTSGLKIGLVCIYDAHGL
jgi:hypothetical protein